MIIRLWQHFFAVLENLNLDLEKSWKMHLKDCGNPVSSKFVSSQNWNEIASDFLHFRAV